MIRQSARKTVISPGIERMVIRLMAITSLVRAVDQLRG
jgi:hypothetical protein